MFVLQNKKRVMLINLIIAFILIRPHFTFFPPVAAVYLFDVIVLLLLVISSQHYKLHFTAVESLPLLALFFIVFLKSIIFELDTDAFLSIFKICYYILIFKYLSQLAKNTYTYNDLRKILLFCFVFNLFICSIQLLNLPGLINIVHPMYGVNKLRSLWSGYPRIYGTFFNANWFGVYLVFMFAFFTADFCNSGKFFYYLLEIICLVYMLFISGSRTAMIGSSTVFILVLLLSKKIKTAICTILTVVLFGIIGFFIAQSVPLFAKTLRRFTSYFDSVSSDDADVSIAAGSRWNEWVNSIELYQESPLFGNIMGEVIPHNTYLAILIRFGIIGAIFLIPIIFEYLKKCFSTQNPIRTWILSFQIGLLIVFFSGDYLFTTQVIAMDIAALAIGYSVHVSPKMMALEVISNDKRK